MSQHYWFHEKTKSEINIQDLSAKSQSLHKYDPTGHIHMNIFNTFSKDEKQINKQFHLLFAKTPTSLGLSFEVSLTIGRVGFLIPSNETVTVRWMLLKRNLNSPNDECDCSDMHNCILPPVHMFNVPEMMFFFGEVTLLVVAFAHLLGDLVFRLINP